MKETTWETRIDGDNIKINLNKTQCLEVGWIDLSRERDR